MPCFSYTLHCTPYTENKKYFLCFFLYLPKGIYLCLFTIFPRPRAYLIHIRAKHKRRQASKQPQALNALAPIHPIHGGSQYQWPHRITPHQNFRIFVKNLTFL